MTFTERIETNQAVFLASNHRWRQKDEEDGGGVDWFASSGEYHNGPVCEDCGYSRCVHCNCGDPIPDCDSVPNNDSADD